MVSATTFPPDAPSGRPGVLGPGFEDPRANGGARGFKMGVGVNLAGGIPHPQFLPRTPVGPIDHLGAVGRGKGAPQPDGGRAEKIPRERVVGRVGAGPPPGREEGREKSPFPSPRGARAGAPEGRARGKKRAPAKMGTEPSKNPFPPPRGSFWTSSGAFLMYSFPPKGKFLLPVSFSSGFSYPGRSAPPHIKIRPRGRGVPGAGRGPGPTASGSQSRGLGAPRWPFSGDQTPPGRGPVRGGGGRGSGRPPNARPAAAPGPPVAGPPLGTLGGFGTRGRGPPRVGRRLGGTGPPYGALLAFPPLGGPPRALAPPNPPFWGGWSRMGSRAGGARGLGPAWARRGSVKTGGGGPPAHPPGPRARGRRRGGDPPGGEGEAPFPIPCSKRGAIPSRAGAAKNFGAAREPQPPPGAGRKAAPRGGPELAQSLAPGKRERRTSLRFRKQGRRPPPEIASPPEPHAGGSGAAGARTTPFHGPGGVQVPAPNPGRRGPRLGRAKS